MLGSLCRRVTPDEARHFIAQLPSVLQEGLLAHLAGPDRQITLATIESEISAVLGVDMSQAAEIAAGVAEAIAAMISEGEIDALRGQLPKEMKDLFPTWKLPLAESRPGKAA